VADVLIAVADLAFRSRDSLIYWTLRLFLLRCGTFFAREASRPVLRGGLSVACGCRCCSLELLYLYIMAMPISMYDPLAAVAILSKFSQ
jgi:hypothetical protein